MLKETSWTCSFDAGIGVTINSATTVATKSNFQIIFATDPTLGLRMQFITAAAKGYKWHKKSSFKAICRSWRRYKLLAGSIHGGHFRFKEIFCISANGGKLLSSSTFSFLSYFLAAALMSCVFKPNVVSLVKIIWISSYVATVVAEIKVTPVHA